MSRHNSNTKRSCTSRNWVASRCAAAGYGYVIGFLDDDAPEETVRLRRIGYLGSDDERVFAVYEPGADTYPEPCSPTAPSAARSMSSLTAPSR